VTSELSRVPLFLIREGARMVRGAADVLEDLGLESPVTEEAAAGPLPAHGQPALSGDERAVLAGLAASSTTELLVGQTGLELPRVLAALTMLEVRGLIRTRGGRHERRLRLG
jgi:DNA processing protein